MNRYGYIREAVQAHLDIDENEAQAAHLQERYYIFANEAIQTICGSKPKYQYFICQGVSEFTPIINLGNNEFREATEEELEWETYGLTEPNFADEVDTTKWYNDQNIYLLNSNVTMPEDFIAFADKEAYFVGNPINYSELQFAQWLNGDEGSNTITVTRTKATKSHFSYSGNSKIILLQPGTYYIPYKAIWFKFTSAMEDDTEIDMPTDIFFTIPLYIASICLEQEHQQKAAIKRAQFERMLTNCTATDFLDIKSLKSTF